MKEEEEENESNGMLLVQAIGGLVMFGIGLYLIFK
jgi:hypothetical protein